MRLLRFEVLERRMCLTALGFDSSLGGMEFTDTTDNSLIPALVETNHAITTDAGVQQSPSIAVDPNDPTHLVVAYMDYSLMETGYAGIGISISRDSGRSWERDSLKLPSDFDQVASDPIVKFDAQSHVYVSFMAATFKGASRPPILNPASGRPRSLGFEANNEIFVALSVDGGSTWQTPIAVASQRFESSQQVSFDINPDMAIDTLPRLPDGQLNPNFGNIYVTWARYYPSGQFPGEVNSTGGSQVFIAASSDGGQNWHLRTQQPSNSDVAITVLETKSNTGLDQPPGRGYLNWPRVTVGANGDVSVADYGGAWYLVNHSIDAGANFFVPTQDSFIGLPFGSGAKLLAAGLSKNSLRTVPTRAIAADPTRPGFIYVAEPLPVFDAVGNPVDAADIFFAHSEDYGRKWKSTVLPGNRPAGPPIARSVNDDNGGRKSDGSLNDVAADQFMVRLQVSPKGDVGLIWYDTRRDPENHLLDVFGAFSSDGGKTFGQNFRITDQSFDADKGAFQDATGHPLVFLGDSIGLALSPDTAYVAWTDTRATIKTSFSEVFQFILPPRHLTIASKRMTH